MKSIIAIATLLAISSPALAQSPSLDASGAGRHMKAHHHLNENTTKGLSSGDDACSNGDCRGINSSGNIGGHKDF